MTFHHLCDSLSATDSKVLHLFSPVIADVDFLSNLMTLSSFSSSVTFQPSIRAGTGQLDLCLRPPADLLQV